MERGAMLVVFGGLPGTGKTAIARQVAQQCRAVYLRIDTIEQAIRSGNVAADDIGVTGYAVAYALAEANLRLGLAVVADSVNPLPVTRDAWRLVASAAAAAIIEIEVICSDAVEHRRRVESRVSDIPGLVPPAWAAVMARNYEPWSGPRIIIDTAKMPAAEAAAVIVATIAERSGRSPRPI